MICTRRKWVAFRHRYPPLEISLIPEYMRLDEDMN